MTKYTMKKRLRSLERDIEQFYKVRDKYRIGMYLRNKHNRKQMYIVSHIRTKCDTWTSGYAKESITFSVECTIWLVPVNKEFQREGYSQKCSIKEVPYKFAVVKNNNVLKLLYGKKRFIPRHGTCNTNK